MKTLYKFGFKLSKDSSLWDDDFKVILGKFHREKSIVSVYKDSMEKNWHETYRYLKQECKNIRIFSGRLEMEHIYVGFNRYQEAVYVSLLFDKDLRESKDIQEYRNHLSQHLNGFCDSFKIPFKEVDLYDSYNHREKQYHEEVELSNPVIIAEGNEHDGVLNGYKEMKSSGFSLFYDYRYEPQSNSGYIRKLINIYQLPTLEGMEKCVEHFHSVFILFHRSYAQYKELKEMDAPSRLLAAINSKLNMIWPQERVHLFMLNRFIHAGLYNKTFFAVLELNAQMDSIYNQIRMGRQKLEDKYKKQYERVLYNFDEDIKKEPYYQTLLEYLYKPLKHRERLLVRLKEIFEPTDNQIERLRNDNDSKVNFAIQWIMSILSIIIFLYGLSTLWYENTINVTKSIQDVFLDQMGMMPTYLITIIGITVISSLLAVFYFLWNNSTMVTRDMKKVIKSGEISKELCEKYQKKIKKGNKKKLFIITELFKMITTCMILNDCECYKNVDELIEVINDIGA